MRAGKGREMEGLVQRDCSQGARGSRATLNRTDEDEGIDGIDGDIDGDVVDGMEGERTLHPITSARVK
jgi:hypothetical protein